MTQQHRQKKAELEHGDKPCYNTPISLVMDWSARYLTTPDVNTVCRYRASLRNWPMSTLRYPFRPVTDDKRAQNNETFNGLRGDIAHRAMGLQSRDAIISFYLSISRIHSFIATVQTCLQFFKSSRGNQQAVVRKYVSYNLAGMNTRHTLRHQWPFSLARSRSRRY